MARKSKQKILGFAVETQYGVDPVTEQNPLSFVLGREFTVTPQAGESQSLEYDTGKLGNSAEVMTECYVQIEFGVDFAPGKTAGAAAPWANLMKGCLRGVNTDAQASKTTYALDENATGSLTFYFIQSGTLHKLTGARGSVSLSAKAKAFPTLQFKFTGLFVPVTNSVHTPPTFAEWVTPLKVGVEHSAFTIDGSPFKMISLEYDQANAVTHQEYVGHEEVLITDFVPTATLVIEAPALGDFDPFALAEAGSEHTLSFTNGPIGNQVGWQSTRIQFGRATYGDQDGTQTYSIPLRPLEDADAFFNA
ncbi:phage tail tube protein [Grimontia hollisae]|uniref:phage tail tube protein n=1 Tax=Grimontia hollisae TaxID=673 RepID=UPI0012ACBCEE|nr:phage tail tube protein [Grimontia hollisae]